MERTHRVATGHLKVAKFTQFLEKRYYWKTLKKDARDFVSRCRVCARINNSVRHRPLKPISANYLFEQVALDIGQIESVDSKGIKKLLYFIVAIDLFTKWVEVDIIKAQNSDNIKEFILQHLVYRHGCPSVIRCDNGPGFVSLAILKFFNDFSIKQSTSAPFHPESNGAAERFIRTLKQILKCYKIESVSNLKRFLNIGALAYRMVPHRSNGISLFVMMYGREAIMPEEVNYVYFQKVEDYDMAVKRHIQNIMDIHELAMARHKVYVNQMKAQFNLNKIGARVPDKYCVGDLVWMNVHRRIQSKQKGSLHWEGPCKIVSILAGGLFNLVYKTNTSFVRFNRVHGQFLKPFNGESS